MKKRVLFALVLALLWCASASAQQMQTVTVVTDYWARPGKGDEFMNLVKTVGAPVRDKLMAEGVILAWGVDVPFAPAPGQPTHSIWYTVANMAAVEKVQAGVPARLAQIAEEESKAAEAARKKGQKPAMTTAERVQGILDMEKTKTWIFRDLAGNGRPPAAGALPFTRVYLITVKAGKYGEWRAAFDKYIKPTLDKLVEDGSIGSWGLGTEELKTTGDFTHYVLVGYNSLAGADKLRDGFIAAQAGRSQEENDHINDVFTRSSDANAARSFLLRAVIFKMGSGM